MLRATRAILAVVILLAATPVAAQDDTDPRVDHAIELFQAGKFVEAATLFEQVDREAPANYLRLNAMVAWYKADRCPEAMAARSRVTIDASLEPLDKRDLDKVNAYCTLKSARTAFDTGDIDAAEATIAGLETQDVGLAQLITALRDDIGAKRKEIADKEAAEAAKAKQEVDAHPKPDVTRPQPRARWPRDLGIGLAAGGAAILTTGIVKWRVEQGQLNDNPDISQDQIDRQDTVNGILYVSGAAICVTGLAFLTYYALKRPDSNAETAVGVVPIIGRRHAGAALFVRF